MTFSCHFACFFVATTLLACVITTRLQAQLISLKSVVVDGKTEHVVRLTNGDILTGTISKIITLTKKDNEPEDGIILQTPMGELTIYASEIAEIRLRKNFYRHNHRVYILPTAEPIGDNHFIGSWELLLLYGGVGIGDVASVTGGVVLGPFADLTGFVNAKATVFSGAIDEHGNRGSIAVGGNAALVGGKGIFNPYLAATFAAPKTSITALVFGKVGAPDVYEVRSFPPSLFAGAFRYEAGTMGVAFGMDVTMSERKDLHFIAELWSPNLRVIQNTAVVGGLRLCNSNFSMDFGVTFFPGLSWQGGGFPALPVVSFAWTPFR